MATVRRRRDPLAAPATPPRDAAPEVWAEYWRQLAEWSPRYRAWWGDAWGRWSA